VLIVTFLVGSAAYIYIAYVGGFGRSSKIQVSLIGLYAVRGKLSRVAFQLAIGR